LAPLPAPADNAAMSEPPKRKRRRYQFSLWTLMIVVTLLGFACVIGRWAWEAHRRAVRYGDLLIKEVRKN
jgi:hypothetical protein